LGDEAAGVAILRAGVSSRFHVSIIAFSFLQAAQLAVAPSAAAQDALSVPSCELFLQIGRRWVGIDQERAAQVLKVPLSELTNDGIERIRQGLERCLKSAQSQDDKLLLEQDLKQIPDLRRARDRARRAMDDFAAAKRAARPRLERITASLEAMAATPANRTAFNDAEANLSAMFFELEQKRLYAQVKTPLTEDFPPYRDAMAALMRKDEAYAEESRKELLARAEDAFERHRTQFDRLALPLDAQDSAIILQGIGAAAAKSVRWLTLRQWISLVLDNRATSTVNVSPGAADGNFVVEVVRPGYGNAEFRFHEDGRDLLLSEIGEDGRLAEIIAPEDRRRANRLLLEVARSAR
jgi:hypothetical protein